MATKQQIQQIHGDYMWRMYWALDQTARLMGANTTSWITSSGENFFGSYDQDDYDEFNYQMDYIMNSEAKMLWSQFFNTEVQALGGLDSIETAELFLDFVCLAQRDGIVLPTGHEIERHVRERTEHEWHGCGR
jgi:hypothetical protein